MCTLLAVQLPIWKIQILFTYFHRNFDTSYTWGCRQWQCILTTYCLGKHLSNEEYWNQNKLLSMSLRKLQSFWLLDQILVTAPILFNKEGSTLKIVSPVALRIAFWMVLYMYKNNHLSTLSTNRRGNCWGLFTGSHHIEAE